MSHFHFGPPPPAAPADHQVRVPPKLASKEALFSALRQALSLPDYFGNNWDALEECLGDLSWIPQAKILLIHDDLPLSHAPSDQRTYLSILTAVTSEADRLLVIFPAECRTDVHEILASKN